MKKYYKASLLNVYETPHLNVYGVDTGRSNCLLPLVSIYLGVDTESGGDNAKNGITPHFCRVDPPLQSSHMASTAAKGNTVDVGPLGILPHARTASPVAAGLH